jgi:hypothetical protein
LRVAVRVLDPLVSLHAGGAAHGTIVLSHVLLDDNGGVHLIGLGEARVKESLGIALDRRFFPPEQFGNARPSVIGDLWGVAAVLYALLTGRNAFGAELGQIPRQPTPVPLAKVAKHAPPELAALVDRALDVDPGKRFAHAAALRAAMQHVSQQRDVFYCHALGSALAPASSSQPLLDAARALRAATTAPPMMGASTDPPPTATPRSPMQAVIPVPPVRDSMSPVSSTRSVTRERSETPTGLGPPYEPSLESSPPGRSKEQRSPRPFVAPPIQAMMHAETKPAIPSADGQPLARRRREAEMAAGLITEGDAETTALEALVSALSRALEARDEASSTELARTAEKSLERAPRGLTFGVQEQSLVSGTRPVWQAPGTLETPVRALYRAGVASFVFLPGVTRNELDTLVEALSRLSLSEEAPDTLALLGDADFEHILFHIPDLLPLDGDTALERDKKRLLSLLAFDSSFQLEEAWAAARLSGVTRGGRLASRISALARTAEQSGAPPFADDHDYDPVRLARVAACSFDGPAFEPALAAFGPRLRAQLAQLALERPDSVLEAVLHVVHSTRAPKHALTDRQREVVAALVSPELVGQILKRLGTAADAALDELRELFPLLGSEHAAGIAAALPEIGNLALRAEAEHFLEYDASGHEQALGEQARNAEPKTALELVRLLGAPRHWRPRQGWTSLRGARMPSCASRPWGCATDLRVKHCAWSCAPG